jgi:peptidyl-prolyl cis-trans isomerase A (cyclophilin A)
MRFETVFFLMVLAGAFLVAGCTAEQAPEVPSGTEEDPGGVFTVKFETSKGDVLVEVHPEWAPIGAAHFRKLVETGYFDGNRFFRIVPDFVVQFGLNGDPTITRNYNLRSLQDEAVLTTNARGTLTYAKLPRPNSRTTQLFINLKANANLDADGFSPFAVVTQGMNVVDSFNAEYGQRPNQTRLTDEGNSYLESDFPRLDYIKKATIVN